MADGAYRFQGAGQYFYPQANQQSRHIHQRHGSPVNTHPRIGFPSNDTPSPNRSPGANSPAFNMFSQGHQGNHHAMINGQSHQRLQMQMNMNKHYGHQSNQHQGHHQNQQHHDHGSHGAYGNHQHNISSSTLTSTTPHFTPSHLSNGTPLSGQGGLNKPTSEHWQEQIRLAQASRDATQPHHYARNHPGVNKQVVATSQAGARKEEEKEERNRSATTNGGNQVWHALDFGGQGLKTISSFLFRYPFLEKLYFNQNKLSWLPPAIGTLRHLTFLDLSQNQLDQLPAEIGMLVNLKTFLVFDNQLETLPCEMGSLYQLETLGIEGNPLEEGLKNIIAEHGTSGLIEYLREEAPVPEPPHERDWIVLDETPMVSPEQEQDRFTMLSYNILCDKACTQTAYGYAPSAALNWESRREIILNELRARDADIICLQEIDGESFNEFFRGALAHNDYKGVYWPRSRARTMAEKEARFVDGCATFYKNSKWILLDKQVIEFARDAINRPDMKGEHDIFNRVMPRDHIATVTFLENRATGARLIVVNVHIFWDPVFVDVKVVQVAILMEHLQRLAEGYAKWPALKEKELFRYSNGDDDSNGDAPPPVTPAPSQKYNNFSEIPLLVCGDFNSTPDSGVYDLISSGKLSHQHEDIQGRNYGNFTRDGMQHPFQLRSSYANIGELAFTNYVANYSGVLDYIWYSTNTVQTTALLGEIDKNYMQRVPGFPNYHFPSDHLSLFAEFEIKSRKERKVVEVDFGPQRDRDRDRDRRN